MNIDIDRSVQRLSVSGKKFPNIGGGWNCSRYAQNDFVKRARRIGITFQKKNSGHYKALLKDVIITDPLIISLHNPSTQAAKDMCRYVSKYLIIRIGYNLLNESFENNKDFKYHQNYLFNYTNDLEYDCLKKLNIKINRISVIQYVKQCFLLCDKIDFENLKTKCLEK